MYFFEFFLRVNKYCIMVKGVWVLYIKIWVFDIVFIE